MPQHPLTEDRCRAYIASLLRATPGPAHARKGQLPTGLVGAELESFPLMRKDVHTAVPLQPGERARFFKTLQTATTPYGGIARYSEDGKALLGIDFPDGDAFHLEPGGQVEIVTAPAHSLKELRSRITARQGILHAVQRESGYEFHAYGCLPWAGTDPAGLIVDKPRYRALRQYLDAKGPFGRQMMLQTCAIQLNLDLGPKPETRAKRFLAANLIAPFATAVFANSSILAGAATGHSSYRSFIWQHLDPLRTGILPLGSLSRNLEEEAVVEACLEFALKAPLVYVPELGPGALPETYTLGYWLQHPIEGIRPQDHHLENHLSLLFPEVRLKKGFMEIRSVDALPVAWQHVPMTFYASLLYVEPCLEQVLELLQPRQGEIPRLLAMATHGLADDTLYSCALRLMELATEGSRLLPGAFAGAGTPRELQAYFEAFTARRQTPADAMQKKFAAARRG